MPETRSHLRVAGDWAVRGVIPLFVTMSTVLAFALIRASTLAHEGLHAMQLSTTQKIIGSDANRAHNVSASQSVRQRRATRVVLGSSAHVSSSDSDSGPVGSRQNGRRSTGSKDRKRSPGSVSPLKVSSRSGAGQSRHGVASAGGKDALREWEQNVFGKNAAGAEGEGSVPGRGGAAGSEAAGGEADGLGCDDGEKKEVEGGAGTAEGVCGDAAITRGGDAEQEGRQQDAGETGRVGKGGGGRGQTGGEEAARSHTTKDSVSASGLGVHGLAGKV